MDRIYQSIFSEWIRWMFPGWAWSLTSHTGVVGLGKSNAMNHLEGGHVRSIAAIANNKPRCIQSMVVTDICLVSAGIPRRWRLKVYAMEKTAQKSKPELDGWRLKCPAMGRSINFSISCLIPYQAVSNSNVKGGTGTKFPGSEQACRPPESTALDGGFRSHGGPQFFWMVYSGKFLKIP